MRAQIRLDTISDIAHFVLLTSTVKEPVYIKNASSTLSVSGKSFLGLAHAKEFDELWCECDRDIYTLIKDFIVIE